MPLSEIPHFKAFPVVSFILLYWHRIGGETDPAVRVKPIARFDKPQAARRIQFFVFDAAACKAASTGMYKAKVFLDELRAR